MSLAPAIDQEDLPRPVSPRLHSLSQYNNPFATAGSLDPSHIDAWGYPFEAPVHHSTFSRAEDGQQVSFDAGIRFEQDTCITTASVPDTHDVLSSDLSQAILGKIPHKQVYSFNDIPSMCNQPVGHSPLAWDQPITAQPAHQPAPKNHENISQ